MPNQKISDKVETVAKALWRWHHPEDDQFSTAAPNDWERWPETPRAVSLAHEDWSREEFRDQARVAVEAIDAQVTEAGTAEPLVPGFYWVRLLGADQGPQVMELHEDGSRPSVSKEPGRWWGDTRYDWWAEEACEVISKRLEEP